VPTKIKVEDYAAQHRPYRDFYGEGRPLAPNKDSLETRLARLVKARMRREAQLDHAQLARLKRAQ
jgi:hypothetical protein